MALLHSPKLYRCHFRTIPKFSAILKVMHVSHCVLELCSFGPPPVRADLLFSIGTGLWTRTPANCSPPDDTIAVEVDAIDNGHARPLWRPRARSGYPGPCGDGCGPPPLNTGCGISLGTAPDPEGPWTYAAINVTNQSESSLLDCAHTNPSPWIFPNGSIVMAINAGTERNTE